MLHPCLRIVAYLWGMRVLVADDQLRMAALLKRGLTDDGHTVDVALNCDDALWHVSEFTYDAVVADVMLPDLGGAELCRRFSERDRRIPVLMLTRMDRASDRVLGLDAAADAYLVEPFSFDDFTAQLMATMRRHAHPTKHRQAQSRAGGIQVGDLRMRPRTYQAWRGDTELTLSTKEFALLKLFLTHPEEALSRGYIFERIWDCTHYGVSNLVDQYVLYLRRKVDRPFGMQQIETVRGVGYRLREQPMQVGPTRTADRVGAGSLRGGAYEPDRTGHVVSRAVGSGAGTGSGDSAGGAEGPRLRAAAGRGAARPGGQLDRRTYFGEEAEKEVQPETPERELRFATGPGGIV